MHKLLFSILLSFTTMIGWSQEKIDRSKAPKPGPAPAITIQDPVTYSLPNGMTIIVVENHKLPRISATLSIDRGPIVEGAKAGVNNFMGQMLGEGTTKTPKDLFDEKIDQMGANVSLFASGGFATSLSRYFTNTFFMMAEALQFPAFPKESFEKIQSQILTGLKSNEKSASAISGRVVSALAFGKNSAQGEFETEETIKAITLNDIKKAYKESITPSRSYLTFVGDITPEAAKELATKAFGNWKGIKLPSPSTNNVENVHGTEINFVNVPTAVQGEITVSNLINNPLNNPDYHALAIANQILGGGAESKLFMNLREKHGFTYGSYSNVGNGRFQTQFSASAQVRSEKADSAVAEILREINNMREGKITKEELDNAKAKYNGSFALGMEDPARTATYATNIMINNLPKDYYRTFLQKINAVTIDDVQQVSKKYFEKDNSRIIIVGNENKIMPNLSKLGYPVKKFDKYANPVMEKSEDVSMKESQKNSEAISAASIVEGYLKAIGGREEAIKITSTKATFSMDMMGRSFEGTDIKMAPNKHYTEIRMGEMKLMQQLFDGAKGYQAQMGQKKEMDDKEIKEAQDDRGIIPQAYYLSADYKLLYLGTEKFGDEMTYKLKVTKPSQKVATEYYSTKTGLLLKEEFSTEAGGTEMSITTEYAKYQKIGNVLFPYTITQNVGEQQFTMNVNEMKINEGVSDADFKE